MIKDIILMIMMTGGGHVPVDASFIEVDTILECEERAGRAIAVFPQAGINYIAHHCVTSKIKFDEFLHSPEPEGPKYIFDLAFSPDVTRLTSAKAYSSLEACNAAEGKLCVIAYQNIQE